MGVVPQAPVSTDVGTYAYLAMSRVLCTRSTAVFSFIGGDQAAGEPGNMLRLVPLLRLLRWNR